MNNVDDFEYKLRISILSLASIGLIGSCFFAHDVRTIIAMLLVGVISGKWAQEVNQEYKKLKQKPVKQKAQTELCLASNISDIIKNSKDRSINE